MEKINIKATDLEKIKKHIIGYGTEANIYKMNNDYLYKIYTIPLKCGDQPVMASASQYRLADDNTKIIDDYNLLKGQFNSMNSYPYYIDRYGVKKIYDDSVIVEAMERQKNITKTSLPVCPLYISNKFRGCVLKYHKHYTYISYIKIFPKRIQLKIMAELLNKIKELTDNNIYPIDLNNINNILINPLTLNTEIIDIDGKSTVYCETYNGNLYNIVYYCFNSLILNLVYDFNIEEYSIEDLDYIIANLKKRHFDDEYINLIIDGNLNTYEKSKSFLVLKK